MDKNTDKGGETSNNKTQSAVVAALVIGLLVGFFIGRSWGEKSESAIDDGVKIENTESTTKDTDEVSSKTEAVKTDTAKEEPALASGDITGTVSVSDQPAGMAVSVSKVTLSNAGWVVVREDTGNGMGNILGAQWLPVGTHESVSVDLLRKTEANKNYFVALYNDNGDKKFDKMTDLSIAVDGKAVSGVFSAK